MDPIIEDDLDEEEISLEEVVSDPRLMDEREHLALDLMAFVDAIAPHMQPLVGRLLHIQQIVSDFVDDARVQEMRGKYLHAHKGKKKRQRHRWNNSYRVYERGGLTLY